MTDQGPRHPILVALDSPDGDHCRKLVELLAPTGVGFKIGKEFFTAQGPEGLRKVLEDRPFFLDLKFHDIPNTVAGALRSAVRMRPLIVNVHASGGPTMLQAAVEAAREESQRLGLPCPKVIGVTVLTSMDEGDLQAVGQDADAQAQVLRLAKLTQEQGLDGVVCSAREITALRQECGQAFQLVVPGIRPDWAGKGDQKRTLTPAQALAAGASYLVIGRPITAAADPLAAAERIIEELYD